MSGGWRAVCGLFLALAVACSSASMRWNSGFLLATRWAIASQEDISR